MLIPNIKNRLVGGETLAEILETVPSHPIGCINWPEHSYKPDVKFVIAHDCDKIYLKFDVNEDVTAALATEDDADVHKDSCVEFFVSVDGKSYYNYETNAIGALKLHYKDSERNKSLASQEVLDSIERVSTFPRKAFTEAEATTNKWSMMLVMPKESMFQHKIESFAGLTMSANFYKCGDDLSKPHYLTWSKIDAPAPNFHLTEFFDTIRFE